MRADMQGPAQVTRSDWDADMLTAPQIKYAALDALLPVTMFRQLQAWATQWPEDCDACGQALGFPIPVQPWVCQHELCYRKKGFNTLAALMAHMRSGRHPPILVECQQCGRACPAYA